MTLFDVMQGRARLRDDTSGGDDLLVPEVLKTTVYVRIASVAALPGTPA